MLVGTGKEGVLEVRQEGQVILCLYACRYWKRRSAERPVTLCLYALGIGREGGLEVRQEGSVKLCLYACTGRYWKRRSGSTTRRVS